MPLGVTLSRCVCVRRADYITYRLHAALDSAAKVMRCIQCSLVNNLCLIKGYEPRRLITMFPGKGLNNLLAKLCKTRTTKRKHGSGRPKTARSGQIGMKLACWRKVDIWNIECDVNCIMKSTGLTWTVKVLVKFQFCANKWCHKVHWLITWASFLTIFHKVVKRRV